MLGRCRWCESERELNQFGFCDDKCQRLAVWMEWTIDGPQGGNPKMDNEKHYDNTNSGALFRNFDKKEGSKQPDYRGKLDVDGRELEISAWLRTSKNGAKFLSLKVQETGAWKKDAAPAAERAHANDEDVPF